MNARDLEDLFLEVISDDEIKEHWLSFIDLIREKCIHRLKTKAEGRVLIRMLSQFYSHQFMSAFNYKMITELDD